MGALLKKVAEYVIADFHFPT